jgi:AhpC/TSA family
MKPFVRSLAAAAVVGLCGLSPGGWADEPSKPNGDAAKEFAAIQKDWTDAQQAFFKAYQDAKTPKEKGQVLKEKRPNPITFADRFVKFADEYPKSPQAMQALAWAVGNARGTPAAEKALTKLKGQLAATSDLDVLYKTLSGLPSFKLGALAPQVAETAKNHLDHPKAVPLLVWVCSATASGPTPDLAKLYNATVDLLMEKFPDRDELAPLTQWLQQDDNPTWAEKHLRTMVVKTRSEDIKANARFGLANILKNKDEASQPEAEKLFASIVEQGGKAPNQRRLLDQYKRDLVDQAKKELADIKVHGIGRPVPDITGNDLDDKPFKLSDYKGKVVLIDFWGFW